MYHWVIFWRKKTFYLYYNYEILKQKIFGYSADFVYLTYVRWFNLFLITLNKSPSLFTSRPLSLRQEIYIVSYSHNTNSNLAIFIKSRASVSDIYAYYRYSNDSRGIRCFNAVRQTSDPGALSVYFLISYWLNARQKIFLFMLLYVGLLQSVTHSMKRWWSA